MIRRIVLSQPVLTVGDGALELWAAIRDAFPETRHQLDWVHKTANVLDALPKSAHRQAKNGNGEGSIYEHKSNGKKVGYRGAYTAYTSSGPRRRTARNYTLRATATCTLKGVWFLQMR